MSMKWIKWIAIVTMTIDHVGAFLVVDPTAYLVCRAIGRIAYPLFALMVAEGFRHTRSIRNYLIRFLLFTAVSEAAMAVVWFAYGVDFFLQANVFLPLAAGLVGLILASKRKWYLWIPILAMLVAAEWIHTSYGAYGILLIMLFGLVDRLPLRIVGFVLLSAIFIDWPIPELLGFANGGTIHVFERWYQWIALVALVPIAFYDGTRGRFNKWFFYLYYPLHLAAILIIYLF
ncbi:MAG: TraX family protein [Candidatus Izemoplasmatales bacterium]